MSKDNQQIIEEFRKKFVSKHLSGSYVETMKFAPDIEDFILKALASQVAQWRKEIEGMKAPRPDIPLGTLSRDYNAALSDILKKL